MAIALPDEGEITAVGWRPPADMDRDRWITAGQQLRQVSEASAWVTADWWAYGSERGYGDGEALAAEVGIDYKTARDYGVVARAYEMSNRLDILSFRHHLLVARRDDRLEWLALAETESWSSRQMQQAVKAHDESIRRAAMSLESGGDMSITEGTVADLETPVATVDLILTDPPYEDDIDTPIAEFAVWLLDVVPLVKPTGRIVSFHGRGPNEVSAYLDVARRTGWAHEVAVWHYPDTLGPNPTGRLKTTHQMAVVLHGPEAGDLYTEALTDKQSCWVHAMNQEAGGRHFSWQKPVTLADHLIRTFSQPGDTVLDPYAGTGTFLVAAASAGRHAVGCDVDPDRIADAEARGVTVIES